MEEVGTSDQHHGIYLRWIYVFIGLAEKAWACHIPNITNPEPFNFKIESKE